MAYFVSFRIPSFWHGVAPIDREILEEDSGSLGEVKRFFEREDLPRRTVRQSTEDLDQLGEVAEWCGGGELAWEREGDSLVGTAGFGTKEARHNFMESVRGEFCSRSFWTGLGVEDVKYFRKSC